MTENNTTRDARDSGTVPAHVGCAHSRSDALARGVAFCRDCGRVLIQNNDGSVTTARAAGYTPNNRISESCE